MTRNTRKKFRRRRHRSVKRLPSGGGLKSWFRGSKTPNDLPVPSAPPAEPEYPPPSLSLQQSEPNARVEEASAPPINPSYVAPNDPLPSFNRNRIRGNPFATTSSSSSNNPFSPPSKPPKPTTAEAAAIQTAVKEKKKKNDERKSNSNWSDAVANKMGEWAGDAVEKGMEAAATGARQTKQWLHQANERMSEPGFMEEVAQFSQKAAAATDLFLQTMDKPLNKAIDKSSKVIEKTVANTARSATRAAMAAAEEIFPIGPIIAVGNIVTNMTKAAQNISEGIRESSQVTNEFLHDVGDNMKAAQSIAKRTSASLDQFDATSMLPDADSVVPDWVKEPEAPTTTSMVKPKSRSWFSSSSSKPDIVMVPEEQPMKWKQSPPPPTTPSSSAATTKKNRSWFSSSSSSSKEPAQNAATTNPFDEEPTTKRSSFSLFRRNNNNKTQKATKNIPPPLEDNNLPEWAKEPPPSPSPPSKQRPDVVMAPQERPMRFF